MVFRDILVSLMRLLFNPRSPDSTSGTFLIDEVKRLKAENTQLKLQLKIVQGHYEIEKKFANMSDDDLRNLIKNKSK